MRETSSQTQVSQAPNRAPTQLPSSIRDIAEELGFDVASKLVEHFGGVELHVPHRVHKGHKLMVLGEEAAKALCKFCPEDTILVPVSLGRKPTPMAVRYLEKQGLKRWEIARELGISQRHVRRLANRDAPKAPLK